MLKPSIFREYDIRGIAESELLSPDIALLGRGLGTYLKRRSGGRKINVGRDCRLSSTRLRDALLKGERVGRRSRDGTRLRRGPYEHRHRDGGGSGADGGRDEESSRGRA